MVRLLLLLSLIPSIAFASEEVECSKNKNFEVECKVKEKTFVNKVVVNGGECSTHSINKILNKDSKFIIINSKQCYYVSGVDVYLKNKVLHYTM